MVADSPVVADDPPFTIENNVIRGRRKPYLTSYTNISQLLIEKMKEAPDKIGQVDASTDVEETFGAMLDRTIKCALWLKKQGVKRGDVVAVCTHNHLDTFVPALAALCVGAICNPWDERINSRVGRHFAKLSQPKVIFANEAIVNTIQEIFKIEVLETKVVVFGDYPGITTFSEVLQGCSEKEVNSFECEKLPDGQCPAVILYSSGTTGPPKGVQLSHAAILCHMTVETAFCLNQEVPLWFSTMYWISGTYLTLQSIYSGTKRIIFPYFEEEQACKLIQKYKVSWLFLSTNMSNRLVKSGHTLRYDISSLKLLFTGGAVLRKESEDELKKHLPHTTVIQAYGMTELGGIGCAQIPGTTSGSCGVVTANNQMKIIDVETGKTLGPNQQGEALWKTPTMMTCYYRNPEATKNIIDEEGWVHSGDLAYYNEKGELFVVDRLKELIKYRGYQISPGEIENIIYTHPAVLEVAVIGVYHPLDEEHPVACVRLLPGSNVSAQEIIDLVAKHLPDSQHLRGGVKFFDEFPQTPSGKIARNKVKELVRSLISYKS